MGSVITKDLVHGVGRQILLQIVVRAVTTSSPPAWTSSAGMYEDKGQMGGRVPRTQRLRVRPGEEWAPPGCTLLKTHHAMTTHNHTIPDRSPPGSTRTPPSALHQGGGVKYATGASSKIQGRDNISISTWNTRTLELLGNFRN